jgi:hypothetical protein
MKDWLIIHITEAKFFFFTRTQENYLSESLHSLIYKYATKQIYF